MKRIIYGFAKLCGSIISVPLTVWMIARNKANVNATKINNTVFNKKKKA